MRFYIEDSVKGAYNLTKKLPFDTIVCYKEIEDGKSKDIDLSKIGKAMNRLPNLVDDEFYIAQARMAAYITVRSSVNDGAVFNQIKNAIESAAYTALFAKVGVYIDTDVQIEVSDELTMAGDGYVVFPIIIMVTASYREKDEDTVIPKFVSSDLVDVIRIAISSAKFNINDANDYLGIGVDETLIDWIHQLKAIDPLYNYDETITFVTFTNNYEIDGKAIDSMDEFIKVCVDRFEEM